MIKKFTLLLWLAIPLLSMAQPLPVTYEYDASGNRTARKILTMSPPQCSPPVPQDSSFTANSDVETDNYPSLQLYSLTGQLLQTQPVQDAYTVVSLAGLPAGTYILKVHINNRIEDWKVIKQ